MAIGTDEELDYMLEDAGEAVVFSRGASTLASSFGTFNRKPLVGSDGIGLTIMGRDITLVIRDGTSGTATVNDLATVDGVAYKIRDMGEAQADGTRVITLSGS